MTASKNSFRKTPSSTSSSVFLSRPAGLPGVRWTKPRAGTSTTACFVPSLFVGRIDGALDGWQAGEVRRFDAEAADEAARVDDERALGIVGVGAVRAEAR